MVVQLLDSAGNPVAGASVALTLADGTPAPTGTLGGTTVVATDSNGNATFSNLNVNKAGAAYTLSATVSGLPAVVSASFAITAGAVNAINFTTQPGNTAAGTVITTVVNPDGTTTTTPVAVQVLDANGNPIPGASVTWPWPPGARARWRAPSPQTTGTSGTTLGIATFTDLKVNLSGTKQITASSGGVTATSNAFTIAPGPGMLTFTPAGQPATTAAKATLTPHCR